MPAGRSPNCRLTGSGRRAGASVQRSGSPALREQRLLALQYGGFEARASRPALRERVNGSTPALVVFAGSAMRRSSRTVGHHRAQRSIESPRMIRPKPPRELRGRGSSRGAPPFEREQYLETSVFKARCRSQSAWRSNRRMDPTILNLIACARSGIGTGLVTRVAIRVHARRVGVDPFVRCPGEYGSGSSSSNAIPDARVSHRTATPAGPRSPTRRSREVRNVCGPQQHVGFEAAPVRVGREPTKRSATGFATVPRPGKSIR